MPSLGTGMDAILLQIYLDVPLSKWYQCSSFKCVQSFINEPCKIHCFEDKCYCSNLWMSSDKFYLGSHKLSVFSNLWTATRSNSWMALAFNWFKKFLIFGLIKAPRFGGISTKMECFCRIESSYLKKCGDFELLQLWRVGLTINDGLHFGGVKSEHSLHIDSWFCMRCGS